MKRCFCPRRGFRTARYAGLAAAAVLLAVPQAWAQAEVSLPARIPTSPYEPGLMLIAVTGIILAGAAILRLLFRLRLISRIEWVSPVMIFVTGCLWIFLKVGRFADVPNLAALVGFLLGFEVFVTILIPVARLALPTRELRTRRGVPPLLRGMAVVALTLIGMFVLLSWAFPTLSFTPLFVTSGVVSIVLGLALQELLGNLMSGIVLGLERPFNVGDWVKIGQTEGEVVELTWRTTLVKTREGDSMLIPNNLAARETVTNFDRPTSDHLVKIHVGVAYDTPCSVAIEALLEASSKVQEVLRTPAPTVYLKDFQDSSILYELRVWIDNYGSLHGIESELRKQIWYSFRRHAVTIAFPQCDVNLRTIAEEQPVKCCRLVMTGGPLQGACFHLRQQSVIIGRNVDCAIQVSDQHVSDHHAAIEPCEGGHRIRDLGSRRGTQVNGQLVESARLVSGDEIRVGPVVLVYEVQTIPASPGAEDRIVPAPPGRHAPPGGTTGTSRPSGSDTVA